MRDHALVGGRGRELRIDVLRVDVARQRREDLNVGRGQRALDAGAIADADLVESAVADEVEVGCGEGVGHDRL
jgi:hypothetical protein